MKQNITGYQQKCANALTDTFLGYIPGSADMLPSRERVLECATRVICEEDKFLKIRSKIASELKIDAKKIPLMPEYGYNGYGADCFLDPYYYPYGGNLKKSLQHSVEITLNDWAVTHKA